MAKTQDDGSAISDLNELKGYVLGTLAFGAGVTTFLTQACHLPLEPTLLGATGMGFFFLVIVHLVNSAEKRTVMRLKAHMEKSNSTMQEFRGDIKILKDRALENQRSGLRSEMDNEMYRNPSNHDTIIKYAFRYFHGLDGDWVQTDKFLRWKKSEEDAGRPVYLPPELLSNINAKAGAERNSK